jgi:hypothetical protein
MATTERSQVTEIIADFKKGQVGLDGAVERICAALSMDEADIVRDILYESEGATLEAILNEINAEYDLDFDSGDFDASDDDEDEDFDFEVEPDPGVK